MRRQLPAKRTRLHSRPRTAKHQFGLARQHRILATGCKDAVQVVTLSSPLLKIPFANGVLFLLLVFSDSGPWVSTHSGVRERSFEGTSQVP